MKAQMQIDMMGMNTPPSYYEMYPEIDLKNYWEVTEDEYQCIEFFGHLVRDIKQTIDYVELLKQLKKLYELRRRGL